MDKNKGEAIIKKMDELKAKVERSMADDNRPLIKETRILGLKIKVTTYYIGEPRDDKR